MKCEKCSYESEENSKLVFNEKEFYLCSICRHFLPENIHVEGYLNEKIPLNILDSFRKHQSKGIEGMKAKAKQGKIMSRPAFGYKLINKELVVNEGEKLKVEKIFLDFLNNEISLNQLSKTHGFSVNGVKKILKNFTYIGKVKFDGHISQGNHQAIISPEIFNKVQKKLETIER